MKTIKHTFLATIATFAVSASFAQLGLGITGSAGALQISVCALTRALTLEADFASFFAWVLVSVPLLTAACVAVVVVVFTSAAFEPVADTAPLEFITACEEAFVAACVAALVVAAFTDFAAEAPALPVMPKPSCAKEADTAKVAIVAKNVCLIVFMSFNFIFYKVS